MEQARDLLTNELFYKSRSNQKFANRKNQIRYNNIKAYKKRKAKAPTDKILDKNRAILKKVLGRIITRIPPCIYLGKLTDVSVYITISLLIITISPDWFDYLHGSLTNWFM